MMEQLQITVVGNDLIDVMMSIFSDLGLIPINSPYKGMLGNFKLFTYVFDIDESEFIATRREIMNRVSFNNSHIIAMYKHGDYKNVCIFKKNAFRTRLLIE